MIKALTIAMIAIGCQAISLTSTNTSGQPEPTCPEGAYYSEDWDGCVCEDDDMFYDDEIDQCVDF